MTHDLLDDLKVLAEESGPSEDVRRRARERLTTRMGVASEVPRSRLWERARWALAPTAAAALALVTTLSVLDSHHTGQVGPTGITLPESTHPDDHARELRTRPARRPKARPKPDVPAQTSVPPAASSPSAPEETTTTDNQKVQPAPQERRQAGQPLPGTGGGDETGGESPTCSPGEAPPAATPPPSSTTPAPPATSTPQEPACPPATSTPQEPTTTQPKEGNPAP